MERRLSAIMAADVVGYSRLMGANEVGTLMALNDRRAAVIEPCIAGRRGRVVKMTGDGLLAEFASVVDAVACAVSIQRDMFARNVDVPEDRHITLRIGINLGDIIVQDGDIFGDGVNVAARIEGAAPPGGVAVSASVRDNVGNRLDLSFEDMGEHRLKNIELPQRLYRLVGPAHVREHSANAVTAPLADLKPSIAVLPFTNMSGDPEQDYFSDGITEDIITDLSKISGLFVVSRNTSFIYKGRGLPAQQMASELGVRFLLEGSVRRAGARIRVSGQLIDGASGGQEWGDRYDRDLTDIFVIQDEITSAIVNQLRIRLMPQEVRALAQPPTSNVDAYNYYLQGRTFFHSATRRFFELARRQFTRAVEVDPHFARAHAAIASCDARLVGWYGTPIDGSLILAMADKALALDPNLAEGHVARGDALSLLGQASGATAAFERALELDPNGFDANFSYAMYCMKEGLTAKAADLLIRSVELRPDDPQAALFVTSFLYSLGRDEEAESYGRLGLARAEEMLRQHPESSRPAQLGSFVLARLGERTKATQWLEKALAIDPDDLVLHYNAACTLAQLGDIDRAFELLDDWLDSAGPETRAWFKNDADFDPLRGDPRFQALLDRVALPTINPDI